jgi:hypothetical protein
MTMVERPTLSVAETAELLGISRWLARPDRRRRRAAPTLTMT